MRYENNTQPSTLLHYWVRKNIITNADNKNNKSKKKYKIKKSNKDTNDEKDKEDDDISIFRCIKLFFIHLINVYI